MTNFSCLTCANRGVEIPGWPGWHVCYYIGGKGGAWNVKLHFQCTGWRPRPIAPNEFAQPFGCKPCPISAPRSPHLDNLGRNLWC